MSIVRIARDVAFKLFRMEDALDGALREMCALQAAVIDARIQANTSAELSQESMEWLARSTSTLIQARAELIRAHEAIASTQEKVGMRVHNFGGFMDKKAENILGMGTGQAALQAS